MASFINEQSNEEFGSSSTMFSFTSHTMGKQEERKKSDRKTGKERRKAFASLKRGLRSVSPAPKEQMPSIDTIWCIGRNGHWGTPMLDDNGGLILPDYCVDCQHADDKHRQWLKSPDGIAAIDDWAAYELDELIEAMAEKARLEDERLMLEKNKLQRMLFMENLLKALHFLSEENDGDSYIAEIDDDFDY